MSLRSQPPLERLLAALVLRGPEAEFVRGDLDERFNRDLEQGMPSRRARRRLRRQIVASAFRWWRPSAVINRRRGRRSEWAGPDSSGTIGAKASARRGLTTRPGSALASLTQDVAIALRGMRRRPGFALSVALTLGLGIGATTTIFSVVDGVLLRPLPYEDSNRLVAVGTVFPTRPWVEEPGGLQHLAGTSMLNYQDLKSRARSFEALAAIEVTSVLLPDDGNGPELVRAAAVSPELFQVLGASPALGRMFFPEEHSVGSETPVLLSYGAWQRRYAGDPGVIGRSLNRTGGPATIVGVLSADFVPPENVLLRAPDYWIPLTPDDPRYAERGARSLSIVGRLARGSTIGQARLEADQIADQLAAEFPDGNVYPDGSHFGIGVNGLREQTVGTTGRTLRFFLAAAGLLLLLSAMNAAALLFSHALDRMGELGVRQALGAGRGRVIRLLLAEAGVLSVAGALVGVPIAYLGVEAFLRYAPTSIPRLGSVTVDARVLAVAAVVSLAAGMAAGLLPAIRVTRNDLWERLHGVGRSVPASASRLRGVLVGGQVAVAVLLLTGAALLFSSFLRLRSFDPGFDPDGLITMNVGLEQPGAEEEEAWQGWDRLLAEVRAVPGVVSVAGTSNPPFQDPFWAPRLLLPGDSPEMWREGVAGYSITPGYMETVGTSLVAGRDLQRTDGPGAQFVALVNQAFVRTQLDGADPLGIVVRQVEGETSFDIRIVGVVEDVVQARAQQGPQAAIYVPYTQSEWPFVQAVVRTDLPPNTLISDLRKAVARFNPVVPARDLRTMEDRMAATRTAPRFHTLLIGAFALVALVLAAAGLYSSLSHMVGRRKRELGVRMALGAGERGVWWMVVRQGLRTSILGLAVGLAATVAGARILSGFLFEVEPTDPLALAAVSVALILVSVLACLVPARRATGVDPVEVLKAE